MRSHPTHPTRVETTVARVEWPMNDHGAMTVVVEGPNEVRQLVDFGDDSLEETLSKLPAGATVPLRMESLETRGNAWRATELVGTTPEVTADVSRGEAAPRNRRGSENDYPEAKDRAEV